MATNVLLLQNQTNTDIDLVGWTLQDESGRRTRLVEVIHSFHATKVTVPTGVASGEQFLLIDPAGWLRYQLRAKSTGFGMRLELTQDQRYRPDLVPVNVERAQANLEPRIFEDSIDPKPVDPNAAVSEGHRPNIVLIMLESFRHSAVRPDLMKDLDQFSRQGLRFYRHYSSSNCSHLGLFSLFYGKESVAYTSTLERGVRPQLCESLRRSGYRQSFVTCGELTGFFGLDRFLNGDSFDRIIPSGTCVREFDAKAGAVQADYRYGFKDWPDSDHSKLAKVRQILEDATEHPQFVFTFLMSTHFPYAFPPHFAMFQPCRQDVLDYWGFRSGQEETFNRYKNAALYLEGELMSFLRSLGLERTIVIVTGDHGESMGEDGTWSHASRLSDIQTRVPFIMVGGGVQPREVFTPTAHVDILPTLLHALEGKPVPISNCHGRDALSDSSARETVVLTPPDGPQTHRVVIVNAESRLLFKANIKEKKVDSIGLCGILDDSGQMAFTRTGPR